MPGLDIIIVGAGLGGLGAAIALRISGHNVIVLESATSIGEIGAGIQVLPNSSRILQAWGVIDKIDHSRLCTTDTCEILDWRGQKISSMDFVVATAEHGSPFYDLHRADLHKALYDRAVELGARVLVDSHVLDVRFAAESIATVFLRSGKILQADLVIGADGLHSRCRKFVLGKSDHPRPTGDMAYRLLLDGDEIRADPELRSILEGRAVNYWYGPGSHIVTYALRNRKHLNMVLCSPDDMPGDDPTSLEGQVSEMQELFKDWDPRVVKLLSKCQSVLRWRLCIWDPIDTWTHPSGCMILLGDSVHATLPYLASGAGMAFEDGAVLGYCLSDITKNTLLKDRIKALRLYEKCRVERTYRIVDRGTLQMDLNHLSDGPEQIARDDKMRAFAEIEKQYLDGETIEWTTLHKGDDPLVWRRYGAGEWLLSYDPKADVEWHREMMVNGA